MNKALVIVAALLVVGAGLAFLVLDGSEARGSRGAEPTSTAETEDERPRAELADGGGTVDTDPPTADAPDELTTAGAGLAARVEADQPDALPAEESFEVRIVLADDTPVPGAEVFAFAGELEDDDKIARDIAKVDEWIAERGVRLRSDSFGVVRIPSDRKHHTLVVARTETHWGQLWFQVPEYLSRLESGEAEALTPPPADELPNLTLHRDETLRALVVDSEGAPVEGIEVQLRRDFESRWSRELVTTETGANGIAVLKHVQEERDSDLDEDEEEIWLLRVQALFTQRVEERLDPLALPADPVRFDLDATGTVSVAVLDAEGEPWMQEVHVKIATIREGEPKELSPFGANTRPDLSLTVEDGVARFEHIGLDQELAISARRQAGSFHTRSYGAGPKRPGENVEIPVRFGADSPVVQVRVIGPDGNALRNTKVLVRIDEGAEFISNTSRQWPIADEEGRIRIDLETGKADWNSAQVILGEQDRPQAVAELDLSREFPPGVTDLGDLVLGTPQVFVRGRVINELGAGVAGAQLHLSRQTESRSWWDDVWEFDAKADENGDFEVLSSWEGTQLRLGARMDGYAGPMVDFSPGDTVTLQLSAAGTISGWVLADEDFPRNELKIHAMPPIPEGEDEEPAPYAWVGEKYETPDELGGNFRIENLPAGLYDVRVTTKFGDEPLVEVPDVLVVGGQETSDPRLQRIDLRGLVRLIRLELVSPDATTEEVAAINGNYRYGAAGSEELNRWGWFNGRRIDIATGDPALDLDLTVTGFEKVKLRNLAEDRTVELSKGISVRVRLVGGARLPEKPIYIKPALMPNGDTGSIDWSTAAFTEDNREVTVSAVPAGPVELSWILERRSGAGAMATMAPAEPEQVFEIHRGGKDQVIEISLTQAELDTILEQMGW